MRYYSAALLILTILFIIIFSALTGLYPLALIAPPAYSGLKPHLISKRSVQQIREATSKYYEQAFLKTASSTITLTPVIRKEIYTKSLDARIQQIIIRDAVKKVATRAELETRIKEIMKRYEKEPNIITALSLVYGQKGNEFIELMTRVEVERELLKEKKGWNNAQLEQWLTETIQNSTVVK